ncbi:hypothetical protein GGI12_001036 [Dipsacomyces acuminosporus]|nr:hypothetical protein GGI12_001036 [Dipsacomyces acuminosporus]
MPLSSSIIHKEPKTIWRTYSFDMLLINARISAAVALLLSLWLPLAHAALNIAKEQGELVARQPNPDAAELRVRDAIVTGTTTVLQVTTQTVYAGKATPTAVHYETTITHSPSTVTANILVVYSLTTVYITSTWIYSQTNQAPTAATTASGGNNGGYSTVGFPAGTRAPSSAQPSPRLYSFAFASMTILIALATLLLV